MKKEIFVKKLIAKNQEVFEKFDYSLVPEEFAVEDMIHVRCEAHGVFSVKAYSHLFNPTCKKCSIENRSKLRTLSNEKIIQRSKAKYGDWFDYSKTVYAGKYEPLVLICKRHGEILTTAERHMATVYGCKQCDVERPKQASLEASLTKANAAHNHKYDYSKVVFVNTNDKVEIVCPEHGSFWQGLYNHYGKGQGCPACARQADRLTKENFITKSKAIHGGVYSYEKVEYVDNTSVVTITCSKHGDWTQRAASHLAGNGCRKCHIEGTRRAQEDFIKAAQGVHGDKYDYSNVVYLGNKTPVKVICPTHGEFKIKPNSHTVGRSGCRKCGESYGELTIRNFLEKRNIPFQQEYLIRPYLYRFDFCITEANLYIEFHGEQHYRAVDFFGGEESFTKLKERDAAKVELVRKTNGTLIEINYVALGEKTVDRELSRALKKAYSHWFLVNGELKVFKSPLDVFAYFDIPMETQVRDLIKEVIAKHKDVKFIFG